MFNKKSPNILIFIGNLHSKCGTRVRGENGTMEQPSLPEVDDRFNVKKSKSKFRPPLYFLQRALLFTAQNCVVNTRKLSTIGPLVGGYGAPTLLCTSSYSAMGWGHVVKHHMHDMPSRVNMMKQIKVKF
jgi:hypothetical protein